MIIASTPRTVLRRFVEADAAPLAAVFGDAEVMRFGDGPQSEAWILAWLRERLAEYACQEYGIWAVVLQGTERPIGYCGLTRLADINGRAEIELGYRLAKEHWGRGLATEAARAVRDLAFGRLGIPRLISLIDPGNARSARVAEKLGMVHTDDVLLPGYTHPDRVYSCTPNGG